MNDKVNRPQDQLFLLREELADDAMNMTDEEILAESRKKGLDPDTAANRIRAVLNNAVLESGRQRMQKARAGLHSQNKVHPMRDTSMDIHRAKTILKSAAANDPQVQLTLAARNGGESSDNDILSLVQDLLELGIIKDEEDN
ncbi:MAG: hypothetical protein IPM20_06430 [Gammaproteobacteria bacterium]|nr:hypothetical protein [Gammaproteobacteria bacterium]